MSKSVLKQSFPDLGTKQLVAVLAVADNRSFVAAAAQLQMSQPGLTRIIKRVEDVLGIPLFQRTTRVVELTAAGREFVPIARRILDDVRIAADNLRDLANQQRGQVVVSCIMSVANNIMPKAVSQYRLAHPGIELRIHDGIHGTIIDDVRSGAADFGMSYLQDVPHALETRCLGRGSFDLIALRDPNKPASTPQDVAFDALVDLNLISLPIGSETRRVLDATAAVRGMRLNHVVTVTHIPTLLSFVRAGIGAAVVPSTSVQGLLGKDLERRAIVDPDISLDIGLVLNPERSLSPAAMGFLKAIEAAWTIY